MANFIHKTAIIYPNVVLGDNIFIGPYSVIGSPPEHKDHDPRNPGPDYKGPKVIIENDTIIREFVTIHAGTDKTTRIGKNCYIQAHAHIGHDARLDENVTVACHASIGGYAVLEMHSNIGLNAAIHQFTRVGRGTMIGASAFVKGETDCWSIYVGVPARNIGENHRLMKKISGGDIQY